MVVSGSCPLFPTWRQILSAIGGRCSCFRWTRRVAVGQLVGRSVGRSVRRLCLPSPCASYPLTPTFGSNDSLCVALTALFVLL